MEAVNSYNHINILYKPAALDQLEYNMGAFNLCVNCD